MKSNRVSLSNTPKLQFAPCKLYSQAAVLASCPLGYICKLQFHPCEPLLKLQVPLPPSARTPPLELSSQATIPPTRAITLIRLYFCVLLSYRCDCGVRGAAVAMAKIDNAVPEWTKSSQEALLCQLVSHDSRGQRALIRTAEATDISSHGWVLTGERELQVRNKRHTQDKVIQNRASGEAIVLRLAKLDLVSRSSSLIPWFATDEQRKREVLR